MPSKMQSKLVSTDASDFYSMRFASVPYIRTFHKNISSKFNPISSIIATDYTDSSPYSKSVADVTEETRYILEEFIVERAAEDGIDMSLVKPIIDVDLTARMRDR